MTTGAAGPLAGTVGVVVAGVCPWAFSTMARLAIVHSATTLTLASLPLRNRCAVAVESIEYFLPDVLFYRVLGSSRRLVLVFNSIAGPFSVMARCIWSCGLLSYIQGLAWVLPKKLVDCRVRTHRTEEAQQTCSSEMPRMRMYTNVREASIGFDVIG
ncbi:hypothetical protein [Caulobacter sp. S45]|uniref:hypothetical protein n=1 Tax=Caulobacter sp. S45 TaxID=1641861 RepID=UPI00131D6366|nr:hypothetical protein [Caulobacter sp. S45]